MIDVDMEKIDDHNYILFLIDHHFKLIAIMDILNIVIFSPCKYSVLCGTRCNADSVPLSHLLGRTVESKNMAVGSTEEHAEPASICIWHCSQR